MASKVTLGGIIGGLLGAPFFLIPGIGPAVGGMITSSFSSAGATVGFEAAKAAVFERVVEKAFSGIKNSCSKCFKAILFQGGKFTHELLKQTGKAVRTWNKFSLVLLIDGGFVILRGYVNEQRNSPLCLKTPEECADSKLAGIALSTGCVILTLLLVAKGASLLLETEKNTSQLPDSPKSLKNSAPSPLQNRKQLNRRRHSPSEKEQQKQALRNERIRMATEIVNAEDKKTFTKITQYLEYALCPIRMLGYFLSGRNPRDLAEDIKNERLDHRQTRIAALVDNRSLKEVRRERSLLNYYAKLSGPPRQSLL